MAKLVLFSTARYKFTSPFMIVTLYDLILFVSVSESYFLQLLITVATEKQPQKQNRNSK